MAAMKRITVDPVTRIEGHGRVVIELDDSGSAKDAYFQTMEFRGFEKFCEGRMLWDMPRITSRICGFCPVSHHLASVKAAESLLGVEPPPASQLLRELLHMGQMIQSHALHFFFCAMPDFLGKGTQPGDRSVFGLIENNEQMATNAIRLRKVGQDIVDRVGGGRLHPVACIPGGMSRHLEQIDRVELLKGVIGGVRLAQTAVKMIKDLFQRNEETFRKFASFPTHYMGLVKDGALELYDGTIRVTDEKGDLIRDISPGGYLDAIEEHPDARSWTKHVLLKTSDGPKPYRVASLARLNVADSIATPLAGAEHKEFKQLQGGNPVEPSLFYHYARMIELLYCVERAKELLTNQDILSVDVRVPVQRCGGEGVGVVEAPRGTLFHHYWANEDARVTKVNLLVSTAQNKIAMDQSVKMVAQSITKAGAIEESNLNKLETAIRCYDPCLSCSTHEAGRMPLVVELQRPDGSVQNTYLHGDACE